MMAICSSSPSAAKEVVCRASGGGTPAANCSGVSSGRARRLARIASTENRRPSGRNAVQTMRTPIATPPQFSAKMIRLCRLVVMANDSRWKSLVRYPIVKQKKQTKAMQNQTADSSGSEAMNRNEKIRGNGGRQSTVWFGMRPALL